MSLWTPGGEHEVPREQAGAPQGQPAPAPAAPAAGAPQGAPGQPGQPDMNEIIPGFDDLSPEEQAQAMAMAQEMAEARQRISETPAADVVANHVMGFYELAAIHLSQDPPNMSEATVAIDAMAAVMDNLTGRLGENEPVLVQARGQLQMAFVELTKQMAEEGTPAE